MAAEPPQRENAEILERFRGSDFTAAGLPPVWLRGRATPLFRGSDFGRLQLQALLTLPG
jgi:hypothetical protein